MSDTSHDGARGPLARDRVFWTLLVLIAISDVVTKRWAERALGLHTPEEVVGHWLRWTLTYNTGAAMNLSLGDASRVVFSAVAIGMIAYLFRLYRRADPNARAAPAAFAMISAGAFGNLLDRLRHEKGVVDFIDVGTASWRFWTFNVADVGVTMGALLLALLLWREEETESEPASSAVPSSSASPSTASPSTETSP
jgi:signal peptidase II